MVHRVAGRGLPIMGLPIIGALTACHTAEIPAADASGTAADHPSAYTWEAEAPPEAGFDADLLESALADIVDGILTIGAAPVLDTYAALMERGDATCPAWYEQDGNLFWYAQCSADSGVDFDGYGFTNVYEDAELFGEGGGSWDATVVSGAATIRDGGGHTFHLGGQVYDGAGHGEDGRLLWVSNVRGGFSWDGEGASDSWLGQGVSPGLLLYAIRYPEEAGVGVTGNYIHIDGTVGGLGTTATGAHLDELALVNEALGVPCELEPGGRISIRDAQGAWWDVVFDVEAGDAGWELTGDCDGCGGVYRDGDYQGEACADFTPLLDWTDRPW